MKRKLRKAMGFFILLTLFVVFLAMLAAETSVKAVLAGVSTSVAVFGLIYLALWLLLSD